jgi:hypothetical protein
VVPINWKDLRKMINIGLLCSYIISHRARQTKQPIVVVMKKPQDAPDLAKLGFYPEKNANRTSVKASQGGKLNVTDLSTDHTIIIPKR